MSTDVNTSLLKTRLSQFGRIFSTRYKSAVTGFLTLCLGITNDTLDPEITSVWRRLLLSETLQRCFSNKGRGQAGLGLHLNSEELVLNESSQSEWIEVIFPPAETRLFVSAQPTKKESSAVSDCCLGGLVNRWLRWLWTWSMSTFLRPPLMWVALFNVLWLQFNRAVVRGTEGTGACFFNSSAAKADYI